MPIIVIRGRVFPIANSITTGTLPSLSWAEDERSVPIKFTLSINQSLIEIKCDIESYDPKDSSLLIFRAFQYARGVIDCIAFTFGDGLTIILDHLIEPEGIVRNIQFANPDLGALSKTFPTLNNSQHEFLSMYRLVMSEPPLFLVLNDLILAISVPGHVAVSCGRGIEGIRSLIFPYDETRTVSWEVMRHVLNIERTYIDLITKDSMPGRHGDKFASDKNSAEILRRSWTIMDRFLAFRSLNNMPLSLSDHPILK